MLNNKFLGSVIAIIVVIAAITCGIKYYPDNFGVPYSTVFTITGDFYVGHAFRWPFSSKLRLSNVYVLQNSQGQDGASNLQLVPMKESLWQPEAMYFNMKNVVFTGKVGKSSVIAQKISEYISTSAIDGQPVTPQPAPTQQ